MLNGYVYMLPILLSTLLHMCTSEWRSECRNGSECMDIDHHNGTEENVDAPSNRESTPLVWHNTTEGFNNINSKVVKETHLLCTSAESKLHV